MLFVSTHCTHTSNLDFQLMQSLEEKNGSNGKVEGQRNCRCLNKWFSTKAPGGKAANLRWENLFWEGIMRKNHETNEQQQGGPLESMC